MALVVFTGGARSGKSSAAQSLAAQSERDGSSVTVVVFGLTAQGDAEFDARVARHRADRPESWNTIEATDPQSWLGELPDDGLVLVDCLGTLVGLVMDELYEGDEKPVDAARLEARVDAVVGALADRAGDTIVVTNEVGAGVVPAYDSGRLFRDVLGRANRQLVAAADASYLVVCGRLIALESMATTAAWPHD